MLGKSAKSLHIARAISLIFNPPIIASFTFAALLAFERAANFPPLLVLTITFGTLIPTSGIVLAGNGCTLHPSNIESNRHTLPFVIAIASYSAGVLVLRDAAAPRAVIVLMVCYLVNTIIMMWVSSKWGISIHASGVAGPGTALAYVIGRLVLPFFLLLLLVGWARIRENAHTVWQFAGGALITILATWLQFTLLL